MDDRKITELVDKIKAANSITERRALRAELRRARREQVPDQGTAGEGRPRRRRDASSIGNSLRPEHAARPDEAGQKPVRPWRPAVADMIGGGGSGRSPYSRIIG
ncbi:hypothetical protein ACIRU8_02925 [Streptomyces sp. NPDC101175]|uniref:hypothetical protein n=1 Tax=Streptomyces sp. NPDC101175 TaxID=3366123 RepID=UPI0038362E9A